MSHSTSGSFDSILQPAAAWIDLMEQIARCARLLKKGISQPLSGGDLNESQFSLLWACNSPSVEGIAQNRLAEMLAVSSAHVSGIVEQLRGRGLLLGQRSAIDRRCQNWQATDAGRAAVVSVLQAVAEWVERVESRLPVEGQRQLAAVLSQLLDVLREEHPPTHAHSLPFPRIHGGDGDTEGGKTSGAGEKGEQSTGQAYGGAAA